MASNLMHRFFVIALVSSVVAAPFARSADDEALPPGATAVAPAAPENPAPPPSPKPRRQGPVIKDAEGTEAPNRFEAETVIKSRYKLNGKPLEVDPD